MSFYLAIIVHMEPVMLCSKVVCSVLFSQRIPSSINPCTIRVSHTGNSRAEELDLSIGDFLF